jgi:hypothetical protein
MQVETPFRVQTFNGLTETAMRLLIILETNYGRSFDFQTLRLMDFFTVYSGDIDGPQSLHPTNSGRGGTYNVRKSLIPKAIDFLVAADLLNNENALYSAKNQDDGDPYRSTYLQGIQSAAKWMNGRIRDVGLKSFTAEMLQTAIELMEESLSAQPPQSPDDVFVFLKDSYESDLCRLEGLQDSCEIFKCLLDVDLKSAANDNGKMVPPFPYFDDVYAMATKEITSTSSRYSGLLCMHSDKHTDPAAIS